MRLCLGFTASLHQQDDFEGEAGEGHAVRPPDVPRGSAHREELAHAPLSRMMQRTRTRTAAVLYIQKANAIPIIPVHMNCAILGALFRLTEAPWCSVFHHCTEK